METKKVVQVKISKAVMAEMFIDSGKAFKVIKGLPMSAKLSNLDYDFRKRVFIATFTDDSFEDVKDGAIPEFEVQYQAYIIDNTPNIIIPTPEG